MALNVDTSQNDALNLQVLQRRDPDVSEILDTASHVVVYDFDQSRNEWKRSDVEGCLFVVKRYSKPRFQLVINNRLSTDVLKLTLTPETKTDSQEGFLMVHLPDADSPSGSIVYGIWFYPDEERTRTTKMIKRAVNALRSQVKNSTTTTTTTGSKKKPRGTPPKPTTASNAPRSNLIIPPVSTSATTGMLTPSSLRRSESNSSLGSNKGITPRPNLLVPGNFNRQQPQRQLTRSLSNASSTGSQLMVPSSPSHVNKQVLKQTLISLLQEDDAFFSMVANAYQQKQRQYGQR